MSVLINQPKLSLQQSKEKYKNLTKELAKILTSDGNSMFDVIAQNTVQLYYTSIEQEYNHPHKLLTWIFGNHLKNINAIQTTINNISLLKEYHTTINNIKSFIEEDSNNQYNQKYHGYPYIPHRDKHLTNISQLDNGQQVSSRIPIDYGETIQNIIQNCHNSLQRLISEGGVSKSISNTSEIIIKINDIIKNNPEVINNIIKQYRKKDSKQGSSHPTSLE